MIRNTKRSYVTDKATFSYRRQREKKSQISPLFAAVLNNSAYGLVQCRKTSTPQLSYARSHAVCCGRLHHRASPRAARRGVSRYSTGPQRRRASFVARADEFFTQRADSTPPNTKIYILLAAGQDSRFLGELRLISDCELSANATVE